MALPSTLRNLGPRTDEILSNVGINSAEELRDVGYIATYVSIKTMFPRHVNRMWLYAMYGALTNQNCLKLTAEQKAMLNRELEAYMNRS